MTTRISIGLDSTICVLGCGVALRRLELMGGKRWTLVVYWLNRQWTIL